MTKSNALLDSTMPPNTWRITSTGFFKICFTKTYPEMLRGIMQEGEFVDVLKRIDGILRIPKWLILLIFLPLTCFIPIPILIIFDFPFAVGEICTGCALLIFSVIEIVALVFVLKLNKTRNVRFNEILGELNQRFYSRGVKWVYARGNKYMPTYIDIMFFDPNVFPQGSMPNPWEQPSYSAINTPATTNPYMNSTPSSYTPPAPPSLIPESSAIITLSTEMSYPGDPSAGY